MTQQRTWSTIGLFIIALVMSIPFYSASAYAASVSITKNHGQAGIDTFIDGQGDVWTLEAQVTNIVGQVQPNQVKRIINGIPNQKEFACSAGDLGTMCTLQTPLPDGATDDSLPFTVQFTAGAERASAAGTLNVDGTAPAINQWNIRQDKQKIMLSATVRDQPAVCAGLQSVELVDSSGQVVHTVQRDFSRCTDNGIDEEVVRFVEDDKSEFVKLRARDKLGHERLSNAVRFSYDFAAPQIVSTALQFEELEQDGELFLGSSRKTTSMSVEIVEQGTMEVSATSDSLNFRGSTKAQCQRMPGDVVNLQKCTWTNVEIDPGKLPLAATITAKDDKENTNSVTLSSRMVTHDTDPPTIPFLGVKKNGVEQRFGETFYVKPGQVDINASILESGAGVKLENIFADLSSMGLGNSKNPTECSEDEARKETVCLWRIQMPSDCGQQPVCRISAWAKDNVGNEGPREPVELHIDTEKPTVNEVEMTADGRNYFQSRDTLVLTVKVEESNGVRIVVDGSDVYGEEEKMLTFTDTNGGCNRGEDGLWECSLSIPDIKSGYEQNVQLDITVMDTAGNEAVDWPAEAKNLKGQKGNYNFELLGTDETTASPDFWKVVGKPTSSAPFVDLDTTHLINRRMSFTVNLDDKTSNVKIKRITMDTSDCQSGTIKEQEGEEPVSVGLKRALVFNAVDKKPVIILEFEQFDGQEKFGPVLKEKETFTTHDLIYTCTLHISSQRGQQSILTPEEEKVELVVPFGFSTLGAVDENLEERIKAIENEALFEVAEVTKYLNEVVKWVNWGVSFVHVINTVDEILNIFKGFTEPIRTIPLVGVGVATGLCQVSSGVQTFLTPVVEFFQVPLSVLSCNPSGLGVYGEWQRTILEYYNIASGRALIGQPAKSPYENIYASLMALCVPGIVYNLEKYRQVRCREIVCLKNEVPAGIATVESCATLGTYLTCRYVTGSIAQITPLASVDYIIQWLKSIISSPIGLVKVALQIPCAIACIASSLGSAACTWTAIIIKIGDIVDTVAGAVMTRPSITQDPYCSQVGL